MTIESATKHRLGNNDEPGREYQRTLKCSAISMKRYVFLTFLLVANVLFADVAPLRVDINSEGRSDMRTIGWENWKPSDDNWSQTFGEVTVSLRASNEGGSLGLKGSKAIVISGVTLGADGAIVSGGDPAEIEILFEGLTPGPHTFVGYHNELGEHPGTYTIAANEGGKIKGFIGHCSPPPSAQPPPPPWRQLCERHIEAQTILK